jgi:signal transduction histidine kinase
MTGAAQALQDTVTRHLGSLFPRTRAAEPGAALFSGLRRRLTAWYSAVLAVALLACGLVLYFGLQDLTLSPVDAQLRAQAEFTSQEWIRTPPRVCGDGGGNRSPPPNVRRPFPLPVYIACVDTQGNLLGMLGTPRSQGGSVPDAFLSTSWYEDVLALGSSTDVVDGGEAVGPIYRLGMTVRDPRTGSTLGIVQVGQSIGVQLEAVEVLRGLLFLIAVVAMISSVAIGLILAERALEPARLAVARQQAFIADASHQLRTPLTLLRADAEVLLRGRDRLDPDDAELLDDIVAETEHMEQIATSLLTLARLDAQQVHLEHDVVDLSDLAGDVARRVKARAEAKGLDVREEFSAPARIVGDHHMVEQAALVLVDNAIKYTPPGGTVALRTSTNDGHALLTVEDTGVGIPPEHLHRLGERFYRVDPARSRSTGGAGLGLAIAYRIAGAHGGSLDITAAPGGGTRATLNLPAARSRS